MYETRDLAKYLALVISEEEVRLLDIDKFLPKRYNEGTRNSKPTIAFLDSDTVKTKEGVKDKWVSEGYTEPSVDVLRLMCALLFRELVGIVLEGHVYTACGRIFNQLLGGPIGLALTTLVAEILMRKFDLRFLKKLETMGLEKPPLRERYVDDINVVAVAIKTEGELKNCLENEGLKYHPVL